MTKASIASRASNAASDATLDTAADIVPLERERKFLCWGLPTGVRGVLFRQGYLATGAVQVRVRISDDRAWLTAKAKMAGAQHLEGALIRREAEAEIARDAADAFLALAADVLAKTRHAVGGWEIDAFGGDLTGLVLGEVELAGPDAPLPAAPAGVIIGPEVTHDPRFENAALARLAPDDRRALVAEVLATLDGGRPD